MMMMTMMRPHRCCRRSRERCMIVVVVVVTWETCWKSREISFNECETGRQARFRKCGRRRIEDSENEDQHHPFSIEKKKHSEEEEGKQKIKRSAGFRTQIPTFSYIHQAPSELPCLASLLSPTHTHTHIIKSALHNESQPGGFSIQLANHGRGALSTSILTDPCMEAVLAARTHSVVLSKPALSSEIKCWQGRSSSTRKIRDIELSRSILFARRSIWVTINAKEADARE